MAQREGGVPIRLVLREQMRNAAHGIGSRGVQIRQTKTQPNGEDVAES